MWTTLYPTPNPVVQYGTDPKNLNMSRNGTTGTYSSGGWKGQVRGAIALEICQPVGFITPPLCPSAFPAAAYSLHDRSQAGHCLLLSRRRSHPIARLLARPGLVPTRLELSHTVCSRVTHE